MAYILGKRAKLSAISCQLSALSYQLSAISSQFSLQLARLTSSVLLVPLVPLPGGMPGLNRVDGVARRPVVELKKRDCASLLDRKRLADVVLYTLVIWSSFRIQFLLSVELWLSSA